jgi:DNA polymerase III subunit alpha
MCDSTPRKRLAVVFDTETSGLPNRGAGPHLKDPCRIVQIAWQLVDLDASETSVVAEASSVVLPTGEWEMSPDAEKTHHLTFSHVCQQGAPLSIVLRDLGFWAHLATADMIVAHNMHFDRSALLSEFQRSPEEFPETQIKAFLQKRAFCTMKSTTKLLRLPFPKGRVSSTDFKWPKLLELHMFLFGVGFDGAHDAREDVRATVRCLRALMRPPNS